MNREIQPVRTVRECPSCGSNNVDCPRTYDTRQPSPRFVCCQPKCLDCGHLGRKFDDISEAFAAWEKSA